MTNVAVACWFAQVKRAYAPTELKTMKYNSGPIAAGGNVQIPAQSGHKKFITSVDNERNQAVVAIKIAAIV